MYQDSKLISDMLALSWVWLYGIEIPTWIFSVLAFRCVWLSVYDPDSNLDSECAQASVHIIFNIILNILKSCDCTGIKLLKNAECACVEMCLTMYQDSCLHSECNCIQMCWIVPCFPLEFWVCLRSAKFDYTSIPTWILKVLDDVDTYQGPPFAVVWPYKC